MNLIGRYVNGNYTVSIFDDGTKIRATEDDNFIPSFAENCDVKITDKCDGGCAFCYEGCTLNGKHGDILNYKFLETLHPYTELAINGNDLSHPEILTFLNKLKEKKIIVNLTVNQIHFERHFGFIQALIDCKLIYGLGISLVNPTDDFIHLIKKIPNAVVHTINGILKPSDVAALVKNDIKILILGYKHLRRGADWYDKNSDDIIKNQNWLKDNLKDIIDKFNVISFDNLALEQLNVKNLISENDWEHFYMGDDGHFTFYIDMVEGTFSKNSISTEDKRFPINNLSVDEMFQFIKNNS